MSGISIQHLSHTFSDKPVLHDINIDVVKGQVLALLGPSGCGKSTLLKSLAGLLSPTEGRIYFDDECVYSVSQSLPSERRHLGMVFQDYALWPHMSVEKNVSFPLEMRGIPRQEREERVFKALEMVGLNALSNRRPSELSGGQQQRVALARAIVAKPKVILFDEPLSNLDRHLRESLCEEIGGLLREMNTTAVYVTHDHSEAYALAHQIARMESGRITRVETVQR